MPGVEPRKPSGGEMVWLSVQPGQFQGWKKINRGVEPRKFEVGRVKQSMRGKGV